MGSIILDGAEIGEGAFIGAGSLVPPGKKIPPNSLALGSPAKVVRELNDEDREGYGTDCSGSMRKKDSIIRVYKNNERAAS